MSSGTFSCAYAVTNMEHALYPAAHIPAVTLLQAWNMSSGTFSCSYAVASMEHVSCSAANNLAFILACQSRIPPDTNHKSLEKPHKEHYIDTASVRILLLSAEILHPDANCFLDETIY